MTETKIERAPGHIWAHNIPKLKLPEYGLLSEKGSNGGNLYRTPRGTFEVYGAILEKYLSLGGHRSLLGVPVTNELGCPDGVGRFNHFRGGSIYWTPATGAHVVRGAIRDRWATLGWEQSYLGYPTSDEVALEDGEGGQVSMFERGQIYWWIDTGAKDLKDVALHYTGLLCIRESDVDGFWSDSDEPYAIFGGISASGEYTKVTQIYSDVDTGESRPDMMEIYRGKPHGLSMAVSIWEHDEGNPQAYEAEVKAAVGAASKAAAGALAVVPYVGPLLAAGLVALTPALTKAVQEALGFADELIGIGAVTLSPKQMVVLAASTPPQSYRGITYKIAGPVIRNDDENATYQPFFSVTPV